MGAVNDRRRYIVQTTEYLHNEFFLYSIFRHDIFSNTLVSSPGIDVLIESCISYFTATFMTKIP